jgi:hypothetical protein
MWNLTWPDLDFRSGPSAYANFIYPFLRAIDFEFMFLLACFQGSLCLGTTSILTWCIRYPVTLLKRMTLLNREPHRVRRCIVFRNMYDMTEFN